MNSHIPRVLCLIADGFEEIELVTPVDLLRRAGIQVTIAGTTGLSAVGRSGIRVHADALLADVDPSEFDLLMLPGGPGVAGLRADGRAAQLAAEFHASGRWVAAICAAPLILLDAGLLSGRRFTAHASVKDELSECQVERVIVDGKIITSRGAGTAVDFGRVLIQQLRGEDAADQVALAIMARLPDEAAP